MAEQPITLSEVKQFLEKAEEQRGELTYEQKLALEHARRFAKYDRKAAEALVKDLQGISENIDELLAVRIADFAPVHADDVRALLAKVRVNLGDDEVQKVLETVERYLPA